MADPPVMSATVAAPIPEPGRAAVAANSARSTAGRLGPDASVGAGHAPQVGVIACAHWAWSRLLASRRGLGGWSSVLEATNALAPIGVLGARYAVRVTSSGDSVRATHASVEESVRDPLAVPEAVLAARQRPMAERLELALSWNSLAAELRVGLADVTGRIDASR